LDGVANRTAGNARLAGLEAELGLKNYDYNAVLSVFVRTRSPPLDFLIPQTD
jgi:hypothetical protein